VRFARRRTRHRRTCRVVSVGRGATRPGSTVPVAWRTRDIVSYRRTVVQEGGPPGIPDEMLAQPRTEITSTSRRLWPAEAALDELSEHINCIGKVAGSGCDVKLRSVAPSLQPVACGSLSDAAIQCPAFKFRSLKVDGKPPAGVVESPELESVLVFPVAVAVAPIPRLEEFDRVRGHWGFATPRLDRYPAPAAWSPPKGCLPREACLEPAAHRFEGVGSTRGVARPTSALVQCGRPPPVAPGILRLSTPPPGPRRRAVRAGLHRSGDPATRPVSAVPGLTARVAGRADDVVLADTGNTSGVAKDAERAERRRMPVR
jgi:hypothetical protein